LEQRQGLKIACIEEIAYCQGYIDADQLYQLAKPLAKSSYGRYLMDIINNDIRAEQIQQMNQVASGNGFQQELAGTERVIL
jgi:glucose-1-phosphate thymidylyltransferase